jgi:hypothetical protein
VQSNDLWDLPIIAMTADRSTNIAAKIFQAVGFGEYRRAECSRREAAFGRILDQKNDLIHSHHAIA